MIEQLPDMAELWQATLAWQPDEQQRSQFQKLYAAILVGNQQLNLTRITEPQEFWEKHLWDSLSGVKPFLGETESPATPLRVIDIGTGAGFPGVPAAIALPHWQLTLLDSTRKKVAFLEGLIQDLQLGNARTWVDRVEAAGHHPRHRQHYDLALVRAVAAAAVCAEYALPLLKVGGQAVLYRGQWSEEEAESLHGAIAQLGGNLETVEAFTTPLTQSVRHCLYLRKTAATHPQFPRPVGIPTHKPLG